MKKKYITLFTIVDFGEGAYIKFKRKKIICPLWLYFNDSVWSDNYLQLCFKNRPGYTGSGNIKNNAIWFNEIYINIFLVKQT